MIFTLLQWIGSFSLAFPSENVVDFLNLKGFSVSTILSVESQFGMHETFRCCRNVKNRISLSVWSLENYW